MIRSLSRWFRSLTSNHGSKPRQRSVPAVEVLEDRSVPATVSIGDAFINEAQNLSVFVPANTAILDRAVDLGFGADRNGDSLADLYVIGRGQIDNIVVYDGQTGEYIEDFLPAGGGLDGAAWLTFGPDGDFFTSTITETGLRDAVLRVDQATKAVSTFISNDSSKNGDLTNAKGMAFGPDSLFFYVTDAVANRVLRYDGTSGAFIDVFVSAGNGLESPGNLLFGPDRNNDTVSDLYVTSFESDQVLVYSGTNGTPLGAFVTAGSGGLDGPFDMAFGPDGHLYVTSGAAVNDTTYRFDGVSGAFIDVVVSNGQTNFIAFDGRGDLYISDEVASQVIRYNAGPLVTLSEASAGIVTVDVSTANGTATAGADYGALSGRLTFAPGETSKRILLSTIDDRLGEPSETFTVTLSNPYGATITDDTGAATIADNEPRISISDVTLTEGRKGKTSVFTFTVTLSQVYDQTVTVSYTTVNGTATTANKDYVAKTGTITFAPGETTKTISIVVNGDNTNEANEVFYVDLFGNSSNSLFTKNRGIGTILNDD